MRDTAIVIGATGLVGGHLIRLLLEDDEYVEIRTFVRRPSGVQDPKLQEHVVDFDAIEEWVDLINGDVLFSTMGTTLKRAGSKKAQYRVDFTYQFQFARAAAANGVGRYVLVSSAGADPGSRIFYSRMKGELEEAVKELPFQKIVILRPSILLGEREERRPAEKLGGVLAGVVARIVPPLRKYRPIEAKSVARAMVEAAGSSGEGIEVHELDEIFALGGEEGG